MKDATSSPNRYKLALVCLKLNRLQEAERALLNRKLTKPPDMSRDPLSVVPNGAAGIYLLGQIQEKLSKRKEAIDNYSRAL